MCPTSTGTMRKGRLDREQAGDFTGERHAAATHGHRTTLSMV